MLSQPSPRRQGSGSDGSSQRSINLHSPISSTSSPPSPLTRNHNRTPPRISLSGSLIPRDYLSTRSDLVPTSPRINTIQPQPQPQSDSPNEADSSHSPQSLNSSSSASNKSNKSTATTPFNHNSFRTGPVSNSGRSPSPSNPAIKVPALAEKEKNNYSVAQSHSRDTGINYDKPRRTSDSTDAEPQAIDKSKLTMIPPQPKRPERSEQAPPVLKDVPRSSSIDSAISSLTSGSHQQNAPFDPNSLTSSDINALINAAGSAEAVIVHLLKEKHHAVNQNTQLWRLVNKQRTLVLGLNRDLEYALKDKDKYKRKARESVMPNMNGNGASASKDRFQQHQTIPRPRSRSSEPSVNVPPARSETTESSGTLLGPPRIDAPSAPITARDVSPSRNANGAPRSIDKQSQPAEAVHQKNPYHETGFESRVNRNRVKRGSSIPPPSRKPPPTPLDLRVKGGRSMVELSNGQEDSDSEYEESLMVDELSPKDRGRKMTRDVEDDGRDRENAALQKNSDSQLAKEELVGVKPTDQVPHHQRKRTLIDVPASHRPADEREPIQPSEGTRPSTSSNGHVTDSSSMNPSSPKNVHPEDRRGELSPPLPQITVRDDDNGHESQQHKIHPGIYKGLISEDYPDLLLPPKALSLVEVRVSSSRLRPSRTSYTGSKTASDEEPVFTLSVFSRAEKVELWRVEKVVAALPQLDQQIKQLNNNKFEGKLPDRSLFNSHSPAKVDTRRALLNGYFDALFNTHLQEKAAMVLCQFLTSDAIEPRDDETSLVNGGNGQGKLEVLRTPDGKPRREGYLTKRGKNFGGWKARYFVLHGPELRYYDCPGGPHLGTIKVCNAQIGRQSQNTVARNSSPSQGGDDDSVNHYRHAFLILEPKKKDSSALVRHVLCAESDDERDAWVEALLEYVESPSSENEGSTQSSLSKIPSSGHGKPSSSTSSHSKAQISSSSSSGSKGSKGSSSAQSDTPVQGFSFDDAVPAEPPVIGTTLDQAAEATEASQAARSSAASGEPSSQTPKVISGPTNGAVIQDAGAWGNKAATAKDKKRSIWGFRTRSSTDLASQLHASASASSTNNDSLGMPPVQGSAPQIERKEPVRPVFGMPLTEAVEYCGPHGVDVDLPAVVYRCIEYLKAKGAASEEGIFRLSGSNVVVKSLKERFNNEGDIDLLSESRYYDVHAVASLFKQYLRELPTTVLTRELHLDFLHVLGKYYHYYY